MSVDIAQRLVTAEELAEHYGGRKCELVRGRVIDVCPGMGEHGFVGGTLDDSLTVWNAEHRLGRVLGALTGYLLARDPDTVREPDVAFIANERLPATAPKKYVEIAPDLVVEVVSPNDRESEVLEKVADWLGAGVRVVWVVWPIHRTVWICRSGSDPVRLGPGDTLTSDDVVPGFALPLDELFACLD